MLRSVMELKVLTMIITLWKMERTHLVIAIGVTGNAIQVFFSQQDDFCKWHWKCEKAGCYFERIFSDKTKKMLVNNLISNILLEKDTAVNSEW